MQIIRLLSDETINKIAAGEVIESPASCVKELIENALDANAKKITIEMLGGGLKLLRISDDGFGMSRLDAKACILRHATSKLVSADDLFRISTKGFRGEALASIASISKVKIATKKDGDEGIELEVEEGKVAKEKPLARRPGTTIEVRSLFYNVPARKKFQKSAPALSAEIFRIVTTMALSHPDVHFELISNQRSIIKTEHTGLEKRAEELLGEEFVSGSFPLHYKCDAFELSGMIGSPQNTRSNKTSQHLFINGRAVVCVPIANAVRMGYATRLEERRHPIFLLYLTASTDLIDVNVHPQKLEVRLREEELFHTEVERAVMNALQEEKPKSTYSFTPTNTAFEDVSFKFEEEQTPELLPFEKTSAEFLGQFGSHLLFKEEDELVFLDSKAVSFRTRFEQLQKNETKAASQGLLVPIRVDLTPVECAMVLTHQDAIEGMGFSLRSMGGETFQVEALPPFLDEWEVQDALVEMAHALQAFIGEKDYSEARQEKLALITASRAKRKSGYLQDEAIRLYEELHRCESPKFCPKGNPTKVHLNDDEIKALFRADQKTAKSS